MNFKYKIKNIKILMKVFIYLFDYLEGRAQVTGLLVILASSLLKKQSRKIIN